MMERLKEASTWRGLAILAGALGFGVEAAAVETIGTGVVALLGMIEVARPEPAK